MTSNEFSAIRESFAKTQRQMADLLAVSVRSIQSFEQSWRSIPAHIERQVLYLVFMRDVRGHHEPHCWEVENCPLEKRKKCPAWEFRIGNLCWFINGTICQGEVHRNWKEKMIYCRGCSAFEPMNVLLADIVSQSQRLRVKET